VSRTSASEGLRAVGRKRENRGGGGEEDGVEEKEENRPSKGGDPKSVVMPVEVFVGSRDS
jgi:hypothetical protein